MTFNMCDKCLKNFKEEDLENKKKEIKQYHINYYCIHYYLNPKNKTK
jgi:hypothetical protein